MIPILAWYTPTEQASNPMPKQMKIILRKGFFVRLEQAKKTPATASKRPKEYIPAVNIYPNSEITGGKVTITPPIMTPAQQSEIPSILTISIPDRPMKTIVRSPILQGVLK